RRGGRPRRRRAVAGDPGEDRGGKGRSHTTGGLLGRELPPDRTAGSQELDEELRPRRVAGGQLVLRRAHGGTAAPGPPVAPVALTRGHAMAHGLAGARLG